MSNKMPTKEQYQAMVKTMPVPELMGLAETFGQSSTVTTTEALIHDVIDAEIERRIYAWEMVTV
jgi:hypothetical protein